MFRTAYKHLYDQLSPDHVLLLQTITAAKQSAVKSVKARPFFIQTSCCYCCDLFVVVSYARFGDNN